VRKALGVTADEPVAYRHVRLACGGTVLSDARNWYVPARLTPAMNRTLETTDTPFGKVVMPLGFRRERLEARRGRAAECPAGTVLSHRALLRVEGGAAISLVVECYTRANLASVRTAR
jgi:chorismate-pyruvate lyase